MTVRKISLFVLMSVLSTSIPAFAAKFRPIKNMTESCVQALADESENLQKDAEVFGDCSKIETYSFTRRAGEKDLSTAKQFHVQRGGIFADDEDKGWELKKVPASQMASELFSLMAEAHDDPAKMQKIENAQESLGRLLAAIKRRKQFKLFGVTHANEDGSWNILTVLDTKNNEIFLVSFGYCGT